MRCLLPLLLTLLPASALAFLYYPYDHDEGRSRGYSDGHRAIDFTSACGTTLYAALDGRVSRVENGNSCHECYDCYSGCGFDYETGGCKNNFVYIDHPNGYQTRYLHTEQGSIQVQVGQEVRAGQAIARSGNVGWTCGVTGCHLHFELRDPSGNAVDPDQYWLEPRRYGGIEIDNQPPSCAFTEAPPTGQVLNRAVGPVRFRVTDAGGSHLRGFTARWDRGIDGGEGPEQDGGGADDRDGTLELSGAALGVHYAYLRAWDNEGQTCTAEVGPFWLFPVPFERRFLLAAFDDLTLADEPLGNPAALWPELGDPAGAGVFMSYEDQDDYVDLDTVLGGDGRLGYAVTWCRNPGEAVDVDVRVGSDDGFKLWSDAQLIGEHLEPRGATPDQDALRLRLEPGYHRLLLAVEERGGAWGFFLRLSRPDDPASAPEGITCYANLSDGPCEDEECIAGTVCREGHCRPPLPDAAIIEDAALEDAAPGDTALEDAAVQSDGQLQDQGPATDASDERPDAWISEQDEARLDGGCRQSPLGGGALALLVIAGLRRRRR